MLWKVQMDGLSLRINMQFWHMGRLNGNFHLLPVPTPPLLRFVNHQSIQSDSYSNIDSVGI